MSSKITELPELSVNDRLEIVEKIERSTMHPGELDINQMVRNIITRSIDHSGVSRYKIASIMSECTGKDISKHMLDKWTAESSTYHRFPAELVPAFCYACHDFSLLRVLANPLACEVRESKEALKDHLQKLDAEIQELEVIKFKIRHKLNQEITIENQNV